MIIIWRSDYFGGGRRQTNVWLEPHMQHSSAGRPSHIKQNKDEIVVLLNYFICMTSHKGNMSEGSIVLVKMAYMSILLYCNIEIKTTEQH